MPRSIWHVVMLHTAASGASACSLKKGRLRLAESPLLVAYEQWAGRHGCGIIGGCWGWGSLPGG